jgi:hypothetical protein
MAKERLNDGRVVSQIVWLIISINSGFVIKFFNIHSNNIVMYLFIL